MHLLSPVTTVNSQKPSGVPCHRNGRGAVGELASQAQPGPSRTSTTCSAGARGSLPGAVASLRGRLELVACYSWHEANEFSGKRNQTQSSSVALLRASCVALIDSAKMCTVSEDPFKAFHSVHSFLPIHDLQKTPPVAPRWALTSPKTPMLRFVSVQVAGDGGLVPKAPREVEHDRQSDPTHLAYPTGIVYSVYCIGSFKPLLLPRTSEGPKRPVTHEQPLSLDRWCKVDVIPSAGVAFRIGRCFIPFLLVRPISVARFFSVTQLPAADDLERLVGVLCSRRFCEGLFQHAVEKIRFCDG